MWDTESISISVMQQQSGELVRNAVRERSGRHERSVAMPLNKSVVRCKEEIKILFTSHFSLLTFYFVLASEIGTLHSQ